MLQVVGAQMEEASLGHTGRAEDNLGNCPGGVPPELLMRRKGLGAGGGEEWRPGGDRAAPGPGGHKSRRRK